MLRSFATSRPKFLLAVVLLLVTVVRTDQTFADDPARSEKLETATFGGGCYWCTEAIFQQIDGVQSVKPGFMGGRSDSPTYDQVLTGRTGHVEVVQLQFDPERVGYEKLLEIFWKTHDPTTRNRQGPDLGSQYRSVVFYHSDDQKQTAIEYKTLLARSRTFRGRIVTTIEPASEFFVAKDDHIDFFKKNPENQYCERYLVPKLEKLKKQFPDDLKDHSSK
ncbi:peptide-methionine (S)-S-oxide reductase MsrA [Roseiconus lacunae]|uniref:Peptide methionine sulfoxide reductase MsrA n=1 Tax=Roseiconus lacunae TaxID=2605694 RepID=A0ABT7PDP6_9BACT|nr:peptide-methionine (S)-S-oxide reductase MsrA [Roseiconus lacunae]MDM4014336.1 peptide-methionine (S)-S-oxide reductase MsrA [Roseiconus lacunae]